jgi:transcriptional regulator with XRE-family HTH domain
MSQDITIYNRVKGTLKSMDLDQQSLASKLGVTQTMVSMALRGKNEKTFQRLLTLMEQDYGVNLRESSTPSDIEQIKADLQTLKAQMDILIKSVEDLKGRL